MDPSLFRGRTFTETIVDLSPLANLYSQELIEETNVNNAGWAFESWLRSLDLSAVRPYSPEVGMV